MWPEDLIRAGSSRSKHWLVTPQRAHSQRRKQTADSSLLLHRSPCELHPIESRLSVSCTLGCISTVHSVNSIPCFDPVVGTGGFSLDNVHVRTFEPFVSGCWWYYRDARFCTAHIFTMRDRRPSTTATQCGHNNFRTGSAVHAVRCSGSEGRTRTRVLLPLAGSLSVASAGLEASASLLFIYLNNAFDQEYCIAAQCLK